MHPFAYAAIGHWALFIVLALYVTIRYRHWLYIPFVLPVGFLLGYFPWWYIAMRWGEGR